MLYVYNQGYVGGKLRRTLDLLDYQRADLVGVMSITLGDLEAQAGDQAQVYWIPDDPKALEYVKQRLQINA